MASLQLYVHHVSFSHAVAGLAISPNCMHDMLWSQGATRVDKRFLTHLAEYLGKESYKEWADDVKNAEDWQVSLDAIAGYMQLHFVRK